MKAPLTLLRAVVPALALAFALRPDAASDAIRAAFAPFAGHVKTRADATHVYVESDGMPDHPMMVGIRSWQQQVPLPQPYTGANAWRFPVRPTPAAQPLSARDHFLRGAIAIAANGVPIFNALNNRGEDAFLAGELDRWGGHAGRADDYHYHIAPLHLEKQVGAGKPIAYALDGYPLYGLTEPDGKPATGLDAFNGHATPTLGYHYHATRKYPYVNGGFHGEVVERDGQVDPQPRAQPIRPDTRPLRGATITDYKSPSADQFALTYALDGKTGGVDGKRSGDGAWTFTYRSPDGTTDTQTYRPRRRRESPAPEDAATAGFRLTSPAVGGDRSLPTEFTCDGKSVSPPLAWSAPPAGTKSFAIVMHHVARDGDTHVYWVLYNLPADLRGLERDDRTSGVRGANTVNPRAEYAPPCSQGPGKKWYTLTLYALSSPPNLTLPTPTTRAQLLDALKDRTLATSTLNVAYERP